MECPMCDSKETRSKTIKRETRSRPFVSYIQEGFECIDCGFSFVNKESSTKTLKNRDDAIRRYYLENDNFVNKMIEIIVGDENIGDEELSFIDELLREYKKGRKYRLRTYVVEYVDSRLL